MRVTWYDTSICCILSIYQNICRELWNWYGTWYVSDIFVTLPMSYHLSCLEETRNTLIITFAIRSHCVNPFWTNALQLFHNFCVSRPQKKSPFICSYSNLFFAKHVCLLGNSCKWNKSKHVTAIVFIVTNNPTEICVALEYDLVINTIVRS